MRAEIDEFLLDTSWLMLETALYYGNNLYDSIIQEYMYTIYWAMTKNTQSLHNSNTLTLIGLPYSSLLKGLNG